jgi:hypothetical protein
MTDVFHAHLPYCAFHGINTMLMQALWWTTALRNVAGVLAFVSSLAVATAVSQLGIRTLAPRLVVPTALTLGFTALVAGLQRLRQSFIFMDYVHPEHD